MKKSAVSSDVLPKSNTGQHFLNYFHHPYRFIESDNPYIDNRTGERIDKVKPGKNGKVKPDWRTETKYPIEKAVLWERFQDPTEVIGVSFGSTTRYFSIDVDYGTSPYHPEKDEDAFRGILGCLEDIGLVCPQIVRSSHSKGIHVFYYLEKAVGTFKGVCAIQGALEDAGYEIGDGKLELFPNRKPYDSWYKGHRLPLQPGTGSCILDDNFEPVSDDIDYFLNMADFCAKKQDIETFKKASDAYRLKLKFQRSSKSKNSLKRFEKDLLIVIKNGFSGFGQTNNLLRTIGCYGVVFKGLDEEKGIEPLADYIVSTITNLDGYSEYCNHQHEIEKRARDMAKSSQNYYWAVGKSRKRLGTYRDNFGKVLEHVVNGNEQKAANAKQRLEVVLEKLQESAADIPKTVKGFMTLIAQKSKDLFGVGFSNATLGKAQYSDIWQPVRSLLLGAVVTTSAAVEATPPIAEITEIEVIEEVQELPAKIPPKIAESRTNKGGTHLVQKSQELKPPEPQENSGGTHLCFNGGFGACEGQVQEVSAVAVSEPQTENSLEDFSISKPYQKSPLKISPAAQNEHKQKLSIPPQAEQYAQHLRSTHPDWQRFDDERRSGEYQRQAKSFFAEVRELLKKKHAASKLPAPSFPP